MRQRHRNRRKARRSPRATTTTRRRGIFDTTLHLHRRALLLSDSREDEDSSSSRPPCAGGGGAGFLGEPCIHPAILRRGDFSGALLAAALRAAGEEAAGPEERALMLAEDCELIALDCERIALVDLVGSSIFLAGLRAALAPPAGFLLSPPGGGAPPSAFARGLPSVESLLTSRSRWLPLPMTSCTISFETPRDRLG